MWEWLFLLGLFFHFLAFLAGGAAFSSPFWVSHVTEDCHVGMLVTCRNGSCDWLYMEDWMLTHSFIPDWLQWCRLVYACGLGLSLLAVVACGIRACTCHTSVRAACMITVLTTIAQCLIGVTTGIFGTRTHRLYGVTFGDTRWHFDWGYILALFSTTAGLVAPLIQLLAESRKPPINIKDIIAGVEC